MTVSVAAQQENYEISSSDLLLGLLGQNQYIPLANRNLMLQESWGNPMPLPRDSLDVKMPLNLPATNTKPVASSSGLPSKYGSMHGLDYTKNSYRPIPIDLKARETKPVSPAPDPYYPKIPLDLKIPAKPRTPLHEASVLDKYGSWNGLDATKGLAHPKAPIDLKPRQPAPLPNLAPKPKPVYPSKPLTRGQFNDAANGLLNDVKDLNRRMTSGYHNPWEWERKEEWEKIRNSGGLSEAAKRNPSEWTKPQPLNNRPAPKFADPKPKKLDLAPKLQPAPRPSGLPKSSAKGGGGRIGARDPLDGIGYGQNFEQMAWANNLMRYPDGGLTPFGKWVGGILDPKGAPLKPQWGDLGKTFPFGDLPKFPPTPKLPGRPKADEPARYPNPRERGRSPGGTPLLSPDLADYIPYSERNYDPEPWDYSQPDRIPAYVMDRLRQRFEVRRTYIADDFTVANIGYNSPNNLFRRLGEGVKWISFAPEEPKIPYTYTTLIEMQLIRTALLFSRFAPGPSPWVVSISSPVIAGETIGFEGIDVYPIVSEIEWWEPFLEQLEAGNPLTEDPIVWTKPGEAPIYMHPGRQPLRERPVQPIPRKPNGEWKFPPHPVIPAYRPKSPTEPDNPPVDEPQRPPLDFDAPLIGQPELSPDAAPKTDWGDFEGWQPHFPKFKPPLQIKYRPKPVTEPNTTFKPRTETQTQPELEAGDCKPGSEECMTCRFNTGFLSVINQYITSNQQQATEPDLQEIKQGVQTIQNNLGEPNLFEGDAISMIRELGQPGEPGEPGEDPLRTEQIQVMTVVGCNPDGTAQKQTETLTVFAVQAQATKKQFEQMAAVAESNCRMRYLTNRSYKILGGESWFENPNSIEPKIKHFPLEQLQDFSDPKYLFKKYQNGVEIEERELEANSLQKLLLQWLGVVFYRSGVRNFPAQVSETLSTYSDKVLPINDLSSYVGWFVSQFDTLIGQFPIEIEIEDIDPATQGNQTKKIELPNLSEALAELYGVATAGTVNADLAINFLMRLSAEVMATKNATLITQDYAKANAAFLGYRGNAEKREIDYAFDPEKLGSLEEFLQESKKYLVGWSENDPETVVGFLQRLMFSAGIIKAAFMRNGGQLTQLRKEIRSLIDNPDDEKEWKEFIKLINIEESQFNEGVKEKEYPLSEIDNKPIPEPEEEGRRP